MQARTKHIYSDSLVDITLLGTRGYTHVLTSIRSFYAPVQNKQNTSFKLTIYAKIYTVFHLTLQHSGSALCY